MAAGAHAAHDLPGGKKPIDPMYKLLSLGGMFFLILFNYTILRDTKDVLLVTAPGSGAEAIPFIKTYVCVPSSILFAIFYSAMSNKLSREQLFYASIAPFLFFFATFSTVLYPNRAWLHPNALADVLQAALPAGFKGPIALFRNWTFTLFYALAELWGSVVVSLLFWGFANEVTTVDEAKKYYPLFGLGANVALIFSGRVVKYLSNLRMRMPAGVDKWGLSLNYLMTVLVAGTLGIIGIFAFLNRVVDKGAARAHGAAAAEGGGEKKKGKLKMGLKESVQYLAGSPYIRNLMLLVICYGMSINLVEVTWKGKLKEQFPDPNAYSSFMGDFSTATGAATFAMMILGRLIFTKFGWGAAALVTPSVLCATGLLFFALVVFGPQLAPLTTAAFGVTPLFLAVLAGAAQNVLSKSSKYSLFDPCKGMAYIPLDPEARLKGKAAIDVIGNPLGKSGGALVQQALIFGMGSLAASTPVLALALGATSAAWIFAARSLAIDFNKKETDMRKRAVAAEQQRDRDERGPEGPAGGPAPPAPAPAPAPQSTSAVPPRVAAAGEALSTNGVLESPLGGGANAPSRNGKTLKEGESPMPPLKA